MSTVELKAYNNAKALRYRLRHPDRKRKSSREQNKTVQKTVIREIG
jgi:hypothetical protein